MSKTCFSRVTESKHSKVNLNARQLSDYRNSTLLWLPAHSDVAGSTPSNLCLPVLLSTKAVRRTGDTTRLKHGSASVAGYLNHTSGSDWTQIITAVLQLRHQAPWEQMRRWASLIYKQYAVINSWISRGVYFIPLSLIYTFERPLK